MLRHRLGQKTFFLSLWETIKWTPMFLLFFGGLSFHLLKALFCHAFSINMEWTTTAKEISAGGFRVGLDRIVRDFWSMYVFLVVPAVGGMIYLAVSFQSSPKLSRALLTCVRNLVLRTLGLENNRFRSHRATCESSRLPCTSAICTWAVLSDFSFVFDMLFERRDIYNGKGKRCLGNTLSTSHANTGTYTVRGVI
jgi:hypothetical protein